ncbi:MAG: ABC transporter ATP-binding protein [Propionibacteriaceae bacterium]|nr:ABC transporter ATP-binding protein [Propionibacteriaceae bacterium]
MNTPSWVIEAHDVRMVYGNHEVLSGISFQIHAGEVVAMLGPNGAGKTTTIEILEGFRRPSSGTVRVLGHDPLTAGDPWRARIGIVMQSWRDHRGWTARQLLDYLGSYYRPYATPEVIRPRPTGELLSLVGLQDSADIALKRLSGGQRRRLDLAIGIAGRPEVVFLDEPTAGFDPEARRLFQNLITDLADEGASVLVTTHDLEEAERVADRILILDRGSIVADGSPDALRTRFYAQAEVVWTDRHGRHVHPTDDPAGFLRSHLADPANVMDDLDIRRATLEDAYLALVRRAEHAPAMAGKENA